MGSQSDWETMIHAADTLKGLGIPFESEVVSAHRTPLKLKDYALTATKRGLKVIIGMAAAMTVLPVMGVPVQSKALDGIDSLLSIVQMPAGIPVHTFAIGRAGAINAALGAAAILALNDTALAVRLDQFRAKQTKAVLDNPIPGQKGRKQR